MVKRPRKKSRGWTYRRVHGQRWQIESGFSRSKRLPGSVSRSRRWVNRNSEIVMRMLTHYLMLLPAA